MQPLLYNDNKLPKSDTNILRNIELSVVYDDYNKEDDFIYVGAFDGTPSRSSGTNIYNKYVIKKLENNNTKLMKHGKIQLNNYIFNDLSPTCTYYTYKKIIKVCNGPNTSISMHRYGSFGWITGIIVKKIHIESMEKMEITVGNKCVCTIDLKLMAKLFGHSLNNHVNDDLIIIPLSRKLFITKSVEQKELWKIPTLIKHIFSIRNEPKELWNIPTDIKHFYSIPLIYLHYHEVRVNIYTTETIKYYVVFDFVKNYYDPKYEQPKSMGILSFEKMNKNFGEINRMIEEKKKNTNDYHITKICINCFKSAILNDKNMTVYQALYTHSLCEIFPKDICKLIVNYDPYCANFEIIIYDELNDTEIIFFRCYNNDFTIAEGMMGLTDPGPMNTIAIGYNATTNNVQTNTIAIGCNATTNNVQTNTIAIGYNALANTSTNNTITNETIQNNFCCML
jgi:hypothetical protein